MATAPSGSVAGAQLYLMINACGGSKHNLCGPWDGPLALKGGPIGVTYSNLHVELYGDVVFPDAGPVEPDASPGAPDGGIIDPAVDGAPDPGSADAGATSGDDPQMTGGCAAAPGSRTGPTAAFALVAMLIFASRKRKHCRR